MPLKVIQIGAGGWGQRWCQEFLPANVSDGLIEVVALVDQDLENLATARSFLGLREDQCYADVGKALSEVKADFCTVVVPPAVHEEVWANSWLIEKFVHWLKGGEPMETNVWDNLQSVALIFAAIESARTGQPVAVQQLLKVAQEQIETT
jgi:predicted dehydrogenase